MLFADVAAPTWTDKEVIVAIVSAVAAVLPVAATVLHILTRWYRDRAKKAEAALKELKAQAEQGPSPSLDAIEAQLIDTKAEADELAAANADAESRAAMQYELAEKLKADLEAVRVALEEHRQEAGSLQRRLDRAFQKDGQAWKEKVLANVPDFKPLDPEGRRTPIVSILTLKGGVGKTTITANLGAALDAKGYRVLLLDLDLQGSLTSLFLSDEQQEQLYRGERLLADFLAASFDAEYPNLRNFEQPILPDAKSAVVPTTDGLAYAETNLTIRWLLREGNRDPRFLLRRELQLKRITDNYDIILMDCPPLINMCCINALAASDYVVMPILPSIQATARVPILLKRLREFRENINPDLHILGIVANRTHRSELTADEGNRLSLLRVQCKDIIGHEVPQFETFIRQNVEVRVAEDEHRPLRPEDEMHAAFLDLASEVELMLPTFCRPSKKVAAEEVVS